MRTKNDDVNSFFFQFRFLCFRKCRYTCPYSTYLLCEHMKILPSFCFLSAPFPKLLFVGGRFQPRQWLHKLSGSELQLHNESSSNRSESSNVKRSHSSFHSCAATTSGCCCAGCACGGDARAAACCCCPGGSPTASPTLASSYIYFMRHVTNIFSNFYLIFWFALFHNLEIFFLFSCTEFSKINFFVTFNCFWFFFVFVLLSYCCELQHYQFIYILPSKCLTLSIEVRKYWEIKFSL